MARFTLMITGDADSVEPPTSLALALQKLAPHILNNVLIKLDSPDICTENHEGEECSTKPDLHGHFCDCSCSHCRTTRI